MLNDNDDDDVERCCLKLEPEMKEQSGKDSKVPKASIFLFIFLC